MSRLHWALRAVAACSIAWVAAGQQAVAGPRTMKLQSEAQVIGDPFSTDGAGLIVTGKGAPLGKYTGTGNVIHRHLFGGQISIGSVRLVAPNGDALELWFFAVWDQATGVRTGPALVTGGTGRFADTSGIGVISAKPVRPGVVAFDITGLVND